MLSKFVSSGGTLVLSAMGFRGASARKSCLFCTSIVRKGREKGKQTILPAQTERDSS